MPQEPLSDQTAKLLRETWFRYLDTILPIRPSLYRYCKRITRSVWDAEDLLQETLLKGFGSIGRGDFCRESCRIQNARTYLFRIATNLWIDHLRHAELPIEADLPEQSRPRQAVDTREAASVLISHTAPQERAALVLKDVFDFTMEEIAVILTTTVGAVKSALHRGRAGLEEKRGAGRTRYRAPSREFLDRFCAAFNARDVNAVVSMLLDNTTYEVPGVGGERGNRNLIWTNVPRPAGVRAEPVMYNGEWIVVFSGGEGALVGIDRFDEEDGHIARIVTYHYCPDTLREVAAELGMKASPMGESEGGYHQAPNVLSGMISAAVVPWIST